MQISNRSQSETRRRFLEASVGGTAVATAGVGSIMSRPMPAASPSDPDAALRELLAGNKRFVSHRGKAHEEDLSILRQNTAEKQEPFAAVLSCADSRVPVEIIFDQSIGHVFVTRVAGNLASPEIIGSLEYGVAVLGVKAILVLGHANCGAVKAAMQGTAAPGQISVLYSRLHPAVQQAGSNFEAAIKANAKIQSQVLETASTVISSSVKEKKLKVAAGYYDLARGNVTLLD